MSCLQAHPDARPSVDSLLHCKLFAIDQTTLLAAKRVASQYVRLPRADRYVERELTLPMRELHRLRLAAGRMPTHGFEALLAKALETCTSPFASMVSASAAVAPRARSASAGLSGGPTVSFAAAPPPGVGAASGAADDEQHPTTAAESQACAELVHAAIVTFDVWGSLRLMVLHDLAAHVELGAPPLPRTDPRVAPLVR